jgi:hypothetical protein
VTASGSEQFHQRGHHVQKAHGRRVELAATGDHLDGAMIALLPTMADAKRLALKGGELGRDLHCTLYFLGGDASVFDETSRQLIVSAVQFFAEGMPEITSNIFGISHWNAGGDSPSWVWSVGDDPGMPSLEAAHEMAHEALLMCDGQFDLPVQHTPWVAHICAAYTEDLTLAKELERRVGPVTFDRIRVVFGGEATDIPLSGAMTADGTMRRKLTDTEVACRTDFAVIDQQWKSAVSQTVARWSSITHAQRAQIREQVTAAVNAGTLDQLSEMDVSTDDATDLLAEQMTLYAEQAGRQMQREAEQQGVTVPEWSVTASALVAGARIDRIKAFARMIARSLGRRMTSSASRRAMVAAQVEEDGDIVAAEVDHDLSELSDSGTEKEIGAAMSMAQGLGRMAVLSAAPPGAYFASEALDKRTCGPCREIDGHEFASLKEAENAYPAGGYNQCSGGSNCRGQLIAIWDDQNVAASAVQEDSSMTTATETLGGDPNPGTKKDKRLKPNKNAGETVELHEDGTITVTSEELAAAECPPGMTMDPGTGECTAMDAAKTEPWIGPLTVEGKVTGDGREFAEGKLDWIEPIEPGAMPLRWNIEDSHGGEARTKAVNVGRIDRVWRDGALIMGEGVFDMGQPNGVEAHRRVRDGFLRGVSIDADDIANADIEFVWPEGSGSESEDGGLFDLLFADPEKVIYHGGRIRGATLCDIPAFTEAYISLPNESDPVVASGQPHPELVQRPMERRRTIDGLTRALTAHGGSGWKPPAEWFENPQLSMPVGIQVTDEGRVYGHAAQWGSCHIGQTGTCVQPPREEGHPYFMTGEMTSADGKTVAVGQITVHTGHAPLNLAAGPAAEHYDNTGSAVADVAVGNDSHGIWVAGAIRPGADPLLVHELRASGQVSGDWRRIGGKLRMVGLLGVNVPGFGIPKMRARVASGEPVALLAAGQLTVSHGLSDDEVRERAYKIVMDDLFRQVSEGRD